MSLQEWYKTNNVSILSQDKISHLLKITPYTEEEIIEAAERVYTTAKLIGLDINEVINTIYTNETWEYYIKSNFN